MPQPETLTHIQTELRSFIGLGFEQLARQWVAKQARAGKLPLTPEAIGSHWSRTVQIDVVAINRQTHDVLLGECKWGDKPVGQAVVDDLIQRKGLRLQELLQANGGPWKLHYVIFVRTGLTAGAQSTLQAHGGIAVDLQHIDEILST